MKPAFAPAIFTAMLGLFPSLPTLAAAQPKVCMPQYDLDAALVDWYGERALPGQDGDPTTVWVSPETGTWSVVRYRADGNGCVIASGEDWNKAATRPEVVAALSD